jgi:prefoldin subunit 5
MDNVIKHIETKIEELNRSIEHNQRELKIAQEFLGFCKSKDRAVEHAQKDVEYHERRIKETTLELDVYYTAQDAKSDNPLTPKK